MNLKFLLVLPLAVTFNATPSYSQMIALPQAPTGGDTPVFAGTYASSTTEYKVEDVHPDIERKILGADMRMNLQPDLAAFVQAGMILDDEFSAARTADGTGFMLGAGPIFTVQKTESVSVTGFALINAYSENFRGNGTYKDLKINGTTFDFRFGGVASAPVTPVFTPYAGVELVPYSEGKFKFKTPAESESRKLKKSEIFNIHLGGLIKAGSLGFRPAAVLVGETTFMLTVVHMPTSSASGTSSSNGGSASL